MSHISSKRERSPSEEDEMRQPAVRSVRPRREGMSLTIRTVPSIKYWKCLNTQRQQGRIALQDDHARSSGHPRSCSLSPATDLSPVFDAQSDPRTGGSESSISDYGLCHADPTHGNECRAVSFDMSMIFDHHFVDDHTETLDHFSSRKEVKQLEVPESIDDNKTKAKKREDERETGAALDAARQYFMLPSFQEAAEVVSEELSVDRKPQSNKSNFVSNLSRLCGIENLGILADALECVDEEDMFTNSGGQVKRESLSSLEL